MNVQGFLQNYSTLFTSENDKVIVFKGHAYAPLFFSLVVEKIKQDQSKMFKNAFDVMDVADLFSQLSTSFLGSVGIYWLGNISRFKPTQQKKVIQFLKKYEGPHKVILYSSEKTAFVPNHGIVIEMEKEYLYESVKSISSLYPEKNVTGIIYFLRAMFQKKRKYSLEELCLLLQYQAVLGKNKDLFLEQWFSKLAVDDFSLFHVSELFFAKKNDEFVEYWNVVFPRYSEMFWVSFWSDQFFKAYCYVFQKQQGKIVSKYETYGLPFSFLRFDWKKHNLETLQKCHQKIYQVDAVLKTGGNSRSMFTALLSCL